MGPPPHGVQDLMTERTLVQLMDGQLGPRALWKLGKMILGSTESSIRELPATFRGFRFTLEAMWAEASALNLLELAPELKVRVFFFLGRKDHWVPAEASMAYVEQLTAPSKDVIWFEASGHEPFMDEPARFDRAMVERVRPVAAAAPS